MKNEMMGFKRSSVQYYTALLLLVVLLHCCTEVCGEESISIVPRQLRSFSPSRVNPESVGPWPFGGSKEDDRSFYAEEDNRAAAWDAWKVLMQAEELRNKRRNAKPTGDNTNNAVGQTLSKLQKSPFQLATNKEYFTDRRMGRRTMEFFAITGKNTTTQEEKLKAFLKMSAKMIESIQPFREALSATNDTTTLEFHYTWLLENALSYAVFNEVSTPLTRFFSPAVLPPVIVMDHKILTAMTKEVQTYQYNLRMLRTASKETDVDAVEAANEVLSQLNFNINSVDMLAKESKRLIEVVQHLAQPLVEQLSSHLADKLTALEHAIRHNDEATEAKRLEQKAMLKEKALLVPIQHRVMMTTKDYNTATYKHQLITPHSFIVSLAVITKFRLGLFTGFTDLDSITMPVDTTVPFIGFLQKELLAYVRPFALSWCVCFFIFLVLAEVRHDLIVAGIKRRDTRDESSKEEFINKLKSTRRWLTVIFFTGFLVLLLLGAFWVYSFFQSPAVPTLSEVYLLATPKQRQYLLFSGGFSFVAYMSLLAVERLHSIVRRTPSVVKKADIKKKQ